MKKLPAIIILYIFLFSITQAQNSFNNYIRTMLIYDYETEWKKVEEYLSKGLPDSALQIVQAIYSKAKEEKNAPQQIKSIIYQIKLIDYKQEEASFKSIRQLEKEIQIVEHPVQPILHSMLAELYWSYYKQNRHRILSRSVTASYDHQDLKTWDLQKFVEVVIHHYKESLSEAELSKAVKMEQLDYILLNDFNKNNAYHRNGRLLRPTLYDFLAFRAIEYFMVSESGLSRPAEQFTLSKKEYLSDNEVFISLKIDTKDTLSYEFYALKLLQDLTRFHVNDENPEALIDATLERLSFVYSNSNKEDKDTVYLNTLKNLETKYTKDPVSSLILYQMARHYHESGRKYQGAISEAHKWDMAKAMEFCKKAMDRFPKSAGAQSAKYLASLIKNKALSVKMDEALVPDEAFKCLITYKNTDHIYWRAVKTTPEEMASVRKRIEKKWYQEREKLFIEHFINKKFEKSGEQQLPNDGDFQEHEVEIPMEALEKGTYIILMSPDKHFKDKKNIIAYAQTQVSDISLIFTLRNDRAFDFYVLSRSKGSGLANAKVQSYYTKYSNLTRNYIKTKGQIFTTDKNGHFQLTAENNVSNTNYSFEIDYKGDHYDSGQDNYYRSFYLYFPHKAEDRKYFQTHFFLDRAIYRPGQTVYFKGILLERDSKSSEIVSGRKIKVDLYDANNQEVSSLQLITNEYGSFSGTFIAPNNGLTGQMSIRTSSGSKYFSVEEYKRPKFEVKVNKPKETYRVGDTLEISGKAQALSGANIDGAKVKYRVVRNASFPYWWYYRGYLPSSPQMEITSGELETDENGDFQFKFKAIPDPLINAAIRPMYVYTVYADVTDLNGETRSSSNYVNVGYETLKLTSFFPGVIDLATFKQEEEQHKYAILSSNLNGEHVPVKGVVRITQLIAPNKSLRSRNWGRPDRFVLTKEKHDSLFPHDIYNNEDEIFNWERGEVVVSVPFNTENEQELIPLKEIKKRGKPGKYVLELESKDRYGNEVKYIQHFDIIDSDSRQIAYPQISFFHTSPTHNLEPGDELRLVLASSENVNFMYELELDGKIIDQQFISVDQGQKLIKIPIKEEYRGNVVINGTLVYANRCQVWSQVIFVPFTNKNLEISFSTFRDKLQPGEKEEWELLIKGAGGEQLAAEMLATLYDESLDQFKANYWDMSIYPNRGASSYWHSMGFGAKGFMTHDFQWDTIEKELTTLYDRLNWFGYNIYRVFLDNYSMNSPLVSNSPKLRNMRYKDVDGEMEPSSMERNENMQTPATIDQAGLLFGRGLEDENDVDSPAEASQTKNITDFSQVKIRKNFQETAFFYPHLKTNEKGEIRISFTIPEALTRWKMIGLAHTKDLKIGTVYNHLLTQKELMVVPNAPRFFREGDRMTFSTKISNISDKELSGTVEVQFFDALTMKSINVSMELQNQSQNFTLAKGQSTAKEWKIKIPEGIQAITYRVIADAGHFSDGEEMAIPVLTNRMLLTESMPLPVRGKSTTTFTFDKLLKHQSTTLKSHRYTLEFTSNPAWYAVQALPYLMEYPYECTEQVFSRFYANSLASHIAHSNPKIKQVFDAWKNWQPDALLSNLEKNQELKSLILEETPWVLNAKSESERKRNIALLFDMAKMDSELSQALLKLQKRQVSNGAWPWFEGMPDSRYITQHIVTGLGHLDHLGVERIKEDQKTLLMVNKAVHYLDERIREDYDELLKSVKKGYTRLEDDHISYHQIQYLYARSFFRRVQPNNKVKEAYEYYKGQAVKYWINKNLYMQGMIALALHRDQNKTVPEAIIKSLKERALYSEEMGMYWKVDRGYYWYQAPIERHALMIEVFSEVAQDDKSVDNLKIWLLKQKQTQDWKTTKATTEACYALLLEGTDWLANDQLVEITVGNEKINPYKREDTKVEAGTGYFKTAWAAGDIKSEMAKIEVNKKTEGVAWGAVYWQYFEQLDKITFAETPIKINKKLFLEQNTPNGPVITPIVDKTRLSIGDLVKVRVEIQVDRDMEYVHMKDMRASTFEPLNVFSGYRYQGGLGYYESTRDAATNFFFSYLPKGTYVFEYPLRVSQKGDFSNGITSIQCMYAPEFTSHSEGIRVKVTE